jgi:hypothetical protein
VLVWESGDVYQETGESKNGLEPCVFPVERKAVNDMKRLNWLSVATVLLILAMSFFVYVRSTAAAPVSRSGTNNLAIASTFTQPSTLHQNDDGSVVENDEDSVVQNDGGTIITCYFGYGISKSAAYPGYIQGVAYVDSCTPIAAGECSSAVDLYYQDPNMPWRNDGDGPIEHGCGPANASILTNTCETAPVNIGYHATAIFTVTLVDGFDFGMVTRTTKNITAQRIC